VPPAYDDSEGYTVLSLVLSSGAKSWKNKTIAIMALTDSEKEMTERLDKCVEIPKEFQAAAEDFRKKAKIKLQLKDAFSLGAHVELVGEQKDESPDSRHAPPSNSEIEERISDGIYDVSAVGFDGPKTRAIVYVNYVCGALCGGGSFHLLRKGPKGWQEEEGIRMCTWVY
jgi:hypothetical protein